MVDNPKFRTKPESELNWPCKPLLQLQAVERPPIFSGLGSCCEWEETAQIGTVRCTVVIMQKATCAPIRESSVATHRVLRFYKHLFSNKIVQQLYIFSYVF